MTQDTSMQQETKRCKALLDDIQKTYPALAKQAFRTCEENPDLFFELGEKTLAWAEGALGADWIETIRDGYAYFVTDVNKEQMIYNQTGSYRNKSYADVYETVYDNDDYMAKYHWGVFATAFLWAHHLDIYRFFNERFLTRLSADATRHLDLGSGSGLWSCLVAQALPKLNVHAVDISKTSLDICLGHAKAAGVGDRVTPNVADALEFDGEQAFDSGASCFLMEHLEEPGRLIETFRRSLAPGAPVFITAAVTAAEVDHIYEFENEGSVLQLLEENGLRVIEMYSAHPPARSGFRYLPRSVAFVAVTKETTHW